ANRTSSAVRTASLSSMIRMLAICESYRPCCDGRRNGCCAPRRQESRQLTQYPQQHYTACYIGRRQARQRVRRAQPLAEDEGEDRARNHTAGREQPVLDHEVADDVDATRADRTTRADLLATHVYEEARETDDAERRDGNHQADEHAQERHHAAVGAIAALLDLLVRLDERDRPIRVRALELALDFRDQLVAPTGLGAHGVARQRAGLDARRQHDLRQLVPTD